MVELVKNGLVESFANSVRLRWHSLTNRGFTGHELVAEVGPYSYECPDIRSLLGDILKSETHYASGATLSVTAIAA